MSAQSDVEVRFTDREITAWGGMALMQKMLQSIRFSDAAKQWDLPQPGSNRGYSLHMLLRSRTLGRNI